MAVSSLLALSDNIMLRTVALAALVSMSALGAAYAAPDYQSRICIIWADNGQQLEGSRCTFQEWVSMYAITNDGMGGTFYDLTLNDEDVPGPGWSLTGRYGNQQVNAVVYPAPDGVFLWENGNPAISIEEYEGD